MRDFWRAVEVVHDVVYFAPDAKTRFEALGLRGFWMGYFASRAAALGEPSAELVTATFHGFAPAMVARAVPDCWRLADRTAVLEERLAIACDVLRPALAGHDVGALAAGLGEVVRDVDVAGRPLAAAELALPVPGDEPDDLGALWRRATVLRELRGDGHVAVLVGEGLGGAAANALQVATGRAGAEQQRMRGWSDEAWTAARATLVDRGWVDAEGAATPAGVAARDAIEERTDLTCRAALTPAAQAAAEALAAPLLAVARAVVAAGALPFPNPVGVAAP